MAFAPIGPAARSAAATATGIGPGEQGAALGLAELLAWQAG